MPAAKAKVVQINKNAREASFIPSTLNLEKRTVEVMFSAGAKVLRGGFWTEPYIEELEMDAKSVRLERFNNGAVVVDSHNIYSLRSVLGCIDTARIENGKGYATVRFSDRAEVEPIFQDVAKGIIRHVSIGYITHKATEVKATEGQMRTVKAIDWEPYELSFVTVPADPAASVRSQEREDTYPCEFIELQETREMSKPLTNQGTESPAVKGDAQRSEPTAAAASVDLEKVRQEAAEAERTRAFEIRKAVRSAGFEEAMSDEMISKGLSADAARSLVIDKLADKDKKTATVSHIEVVEDNSRMARVDGSVSAILHRFDPNAFKLDEVGRNFRNMTMVDLAREFVEASGVRTRGMSAYQVVTRAMHSTSDFPLILANSAGKSLMKSYEEAPHTWRTIAREVFLSDFKEVTRNQLGDAPGLVKVLENGEVTRGTVSEAGEKYKLEKFAKIVAISREALVNDDMDAFTLLPSRFGIAARDLESDLVYNILKDNAAMADTYALFHANHGNLSIGGAAAISITSLGKARAAMRKQKGLGTRKLNLSPVSLLVGSDLETVAQQQTAETNASSGSEVNVFSGKLKPVVESRIDDIGSGISWFLAASPNQVGMIELARLAGETGPTIETRNGFEVEGMEIKARMDVAAKAVDWRGLQKNAGA